MKKITFLGAGSTVFVRNVLGDCMLTPALNDFEYALYDIDHERLEESRTILMNMKESMGVDAQIVSYADLNEALKGAKYIINAIAVGGLASTEIDFQIPKKYGLEQTIGDTTGIGGIMRAMRTLPCMEEFANVIEEVCPDAYFLNYTNPMSILSGYMQRYTNVNTIGLCHSIQICARDLLKSLGITIPVDELTTEFAGINHMAFMTKIEDKNGNDLYPMIKDKACYYLDNKDEYLEDVQPVKGGIDQPLPDFVRLKMMNTFGYYSPESSEHMAEYFPYFIKKRYPEIVDENYIPIGEYVGRIKKQKEAWKDEKEKILGGKNISHKRSREYASLIMEGIETGKPFEFYGNILNEGMITNIPYNACVEIKCVADKSGINKTFFGELPQQLVALDSPHINMHELVLCAYVTKKKEYLYHAALCDLRCAATLSIDDIKDMVDEFLEAHGNSIPQLN